MERLRIVPVNNVDRTLMSRLGLCLEERFLLEATVDRSLAVPETALNRERAQLFFPTLAASVAAAHVRTADPLLAVTDFDLYKTSERFVMTGVSDDKRVAAVSSFRLVTRRDENELFQRLLKQSTYVLGRYFGLAACHNERCVMSLAATVFDVDARDSHMCETCSRRNLARSQDRNAS